MSILQQKNKWVNAGFFARFTVFLKRNWFVLAIMIVVYCLYFSFGLFHISEFITADEHFWVNQRIYTYWHSVFSPLKWGNTKLSDKPGITVALVSGAGLFKESNPMTHMREAAANPNPEEGTMVSQSVYTVFRIPMLIFGALFSLYLFWIIRKLAGNFWIGLWSFVFILLSPIILGISQITNADALLWSFSAATMLSFLAYLKTEEKKFLFLSPFFLGMSLLTKLVAVIFFPFLFLMLLAFLLRKFADWEKEKIKINKKITKLISGYLLVFVGSLLIFAIFMPAVFVKPQLFFDYTIGYSSMKKIVPALMLVAFLILGDAFLLKSMAVRKMAGLFSPYFKYFQKFILAVLLIILLAVLVNWNTNQFFLNPDNILNYKTSELSFQQSASWAQRIIYQFYPLAFSLVPIVLLLAIFLWIRNIFWKSSNSFLIFILSFFILVYYIALVSLDLPSIIRYSIVLYPLFSILAALGIQELFELPRLRKVNKIWVTLGIIAASAFSLWQIKPFYFNYTNDLLPKKYSVAYAWGYGGYEAAQFLNSLPDAKNMYIWSDYYGVRNFFVGKTKTDYFYKPNSRRLDYYVLTRQGQIKFEYWCNKNKGACRGYIPARKYYEAKNPVWEMYIDGRLNNFIKIFKAEE